MKYSIRLIAFIFTVAALILARFVSKFMQVPYDDMMFGVLTYGVIYEALTAKKGGVK